MSTEPVVTVAIPTWNGGAYLRQAIESVLAQSLQAWELFISDDASTDVTVEFIQRLAVRDPRVHYLRNSQREGIARQFSRCARLGNGRYVTIFHQDDVMLRTNLEAKVRMLEANPSLGMVHSNVERIDRAGIVFAYHWDRGATTDRILSGSQFIRRMIGEGNVVCAPTVVVRRSVFESVGPFDPRLPWTCDWDMWMRIGLVHDIGVIGTPLVQWRAHDGQESANYEQSVHGLEDVARLFRILFTERAPGLARERVLTRSARENLRRRATAAITTAWRRGAYLDAFRILRIAMKVISVSDPGTTCCAA